MSTILLEEIRQHLELMVRIPSAFGTLYYTEGQILALVCLLYSVQNDCSFARSTQVIHEVMGELTKDIPKSSSQAVFLCEKAAIPDRSADQSLLRDRARELIRRTIGGSEENHFNSQQS